MAELPDNALTEHNYNFTHHRPSLTQSNCSGRWIRRGSVTKIVNHLHRWGLLILKAAGKWAKFWGEKKSKELRRHVKLSKAVNFSWCSSDEDSGYYYYPM